MTHPGQPPTPDSNAGVPPIPQAPVPPSSGGGFPSEAPSPAAHDAGSSPDAGTPQYGVRAADLGLPSPVAAYHEQQAREAAAQAAAQQGQYGQQQGQFPQAGQFQQPGPYGQQGQYNQHGQYQQPYNPQGQYPQQGQYQQQPSPYGNAGLTPQVLPRPERPQSINIAFYLIVAAGALGTIMSLFSFSLLSDGTLYDEVMREFPSNSSRPVSPAQFNQIMLWSVVLAVIINVALYWLVAWFIRAGHQWARVLGTVFAAISLLSLFSGSPLTILNVLLGVAGIVFAWLTSSTEYIQKSAHYRAQQRWFRGSHNPQ